MSGVQANSNRFSSTATASGAYLVSHTAASNHAVKVFFNLDAQGSAGGPQVFFEVYTADSISSGSPSSLTRSKVNKNDPETLQGTLQSYAGTPTPVSGELLDTIVLSAQGAGSTPVYTLRGGKVIYLKAKCATDTACGVVVKTDE